MSCVAKTYPKQVLRISGAHVVVKLSTTGSVSRWASFALGGLFMIALALCLEPRQPGNALACLSFRTTHCRPIQELLPGQLGNNQPSLWLSLA